MTQPTLPTRDIDFRPNLFSLSADNHNWMGRLVKWIRSSSRHSFIYRVGIYSTTILSSLFMLMSVALSPIVLWGYGEFIRQKEQESFDKEHEKLIKMGSDYSRYHFLRGRIDPLPEISLSGSTRKKIARDLDIPLHEANELVDRELLCQAAIKYDDFLKRYHIRLYSHSQYWFLRLFGW